MGEVTVIGVCIPYSRSRVGPRWNRKMWQDHEEYLAGLAGLLKRAPRARFVVVGDFNQRVGQRSATPLRLRAALQSALGPNLLIATAGLGFQGRRTIDHIALSPDLAAESLGVISNNWGGRKAVRSFRNRRRPVGPIPPIVSLAGEKTPAAQTGAAKITMTAASKSVILAQCSATFG